MKHFRTETGSTKKCILMTLGMGLLIGLIVCGIPLAVMTTLYLQQSEFHLDHTTLHFLRHRTSNIEQYQ